MGTHVPLIVRTFRRVESLPASAVCAILRHPLDPAPMMKW